VIAMTKPRAVLTALVLTLPLLAASAGAEVIVYPKAGQSPSQFQQDQYQCHQTAQMQTGFNPAQPVAAAPPPERGGALRGAAGGAALGAVGGAIGGDAGKGAAIGAGVGAAAGLLRQGARNQQNAQMAQQAQAQQQMGMQRYENSYAACMAQRGYQPR
jgi:hypothetical protein